MPLYIQIYKKRFASDKIHTHVFGFHFQNYIIYIPLPLHKNDMIDYGSDGEIFYAPPYFLHGSPLANSIPTPFEKDLSSIVKKEDDQETMTIIINPEILKDTYKYDPEKNQFSHEKYDPINTKYIIITKGDTTFTKEQMQELTDFLKSEEAKLSAK